MSIHLHAITDESGDTVDLVWYCSAACYTADNDADAYGYAYPCGAESDAPDFCGHCGDPVGNPLTSDGYAYAQELVNDWHGEPHLRDALIAAYDLERAAAGWLRAAGPRGPITPGRERQRWTGVHADDCPCRRCAA